MKLSRILLEQKEVKLVEIIKTNCKEAFRYLDKKVLTRGSKHTEDYYVQSSKNNREPVGVELNVHKLFEEMRKVYNPKIVSRQNAIFCYCDSALAIRNDSRYGNVYVIFPFDGTKYFQSKFVYDFLASEIRYSIKRLNDFFKSLHMKLNKEIVNELFFNKNIFNLLKKKSQGSDYSYQIENDINLIKKYLTEYNDSFSKLDIGDNEVLLEGKYVAIALEYFVFDLNKLK